MSISDEPSLRGLGVSDVEQQVYEVLLCHPDLPLTELATLTPFGHSRLRLLLKSMTDKGMLTRMPGRPTRYTPAPPDLVVEVLALRKQQEIEQARLAGSALGARLRSESRTTTDLPVQVVRGREAVAHRFRQVQQLAKHEMLILDKPPYLVEPDGSQHVLQRELQARGVRYRTIYDREALGSAQHVEELRQLAACGEEARVLADLPMKLVIADRRIGLVPHDLQTVLLRQSALLNGLVTLFDTLWDRATPLWPSTGRPNPDEVGAEVLTAEDQQLLALLAAGLTDQAIARKLGVAQRTVERRVRRAMDRLSARTRFQAGLQAASRGFLRAEKTPRAAS